MWSFWEQNSFIRNPDIAIIGSGIVGLSSALALKNLEPSLHIIVIEKGVLPYGASTRNAGFACFGSLSELSADMKNHTVHQLEILIEKRWKGLLKLRQNLGDSNIDYEAFGGYEIFSPKDDAVYSDSMNKMSFFNDFLFKITGIENVYRVADEKIPLYGFNNVSHMIINSGEGQIDTGLMMKSLLQKNRDAGVEILNGADVERISDSENGADIFLKNNFAIHAKKVLLATNGFAKKFLPEYDVSPARAQVLITKPVRNLKFWGCFHYDQGYYYFRNVGDRVLLGGGRNINFEKENTTEFGLTEEIQTALEKMLAESVLPGQQFEIENRWSGIMGLGAVKTSIVQPVSGNIYCAVRMGGMGIAIGSLIGEEAALMLLQES
jgi:gamma-glutamylputrescine oxidase